MEYGKAILLTICLSFEIERIIDKLYSYTSLSFDLDTSNNECQELCEKIGNLHSDYVKTSYFIVPSILNKANVLEVSFFIIIFHYNNLSLIMLKKINFT